MTADTIRQSYDDSAAGFARYADALVYRHLAVPLLPILDMVDGPVLDVCSGTGALGRQLRQAVAADLSRGQLAHNPLAWRIQADAARLSFAADGACERPLAWRSRLRGLSALTPRSGGAPRRFERGTAGGDGRDRSAACRCPEVEPSPDRRRRMAGWAASDRPGGAE